MKKGRGPHKHYAGGKKADKAELSARLAPPEESAGEGAAATAVAVDVKAQSPEKTGGVILVDNSRTLLPKDFTEEDRETAGVFHLEPVALVILVLSLAFILFIAWQITLMPSK